MPSRKQRRKRDKERRHEYELILVDEAGEERPVDPAELRAQRRGKEPEKSKGQAKSGKASPARGARAGLREVKPPSWDRVLKRTAFFGVFMFLVLSFVGGKNGTLTSRLVPTLLYTVLFAPMLFLIDRLQYRMYLKRIGQAPQVPERPAARHENGSGSGSGDDGLVAQLRRRLGR